MVGAEKTLKKPSKSRYKRGGSQLYHMKKAFPCFWVYSCFLLSLLPCLADSTPGDENWDGGFNLPAGVNGGVTTGASLGKDIYIAGHFSKAGNVAAKGIARWDGTN